MEIIIISVISLGAIGFFFALILSAADKTLAVETDKRLEEIIEMLPGVNCGACGFAGCAAFAQEVLKQKNIFSGCIPGGKELNNTIAKLVGSGEAVSGKPKKVFVKCGATNKDKNSSVDFLGVKSCLSAKLSGGVYECRFGCLGFGDCVEVCPTNALAVKDGLVEVDYNKCIGCGKCVKACPQGVLELVDYRENVSAYAVACNNTEPALLVRKECSVGCIGCGICVKLIKDSPFVVKNNLSFFDYAKTKDIQRPDIDLAVKKCPPKCIKKIDFSA